MGNTYVHKQNLLNGLDHIILLIIVVGVDIGG